METQELKRLNELEAAYKESFNIRYQRLCERLGEDLIENVRGQDTFLSKLAVEGSEEATDLLYLLYYPKMVIRANRWVDNLEDCEDIATESFLEAKESIKGFRQESSFYTWVCNIIFYQCCTFLKQPEREATFVPVEDADAWGLLQHEDTPELYAEEEQAREQLEEIVAELTPALREAMELRLEDKQYKEIAEILDIPLATASTRIKRATTAAKEQLDEINL